MYEKAECCPNPEIFVTLPKTVNFSFGKQLSESMAKNYKGPGTLASKIQVSDYWEKMAISLVSDLKNYVWNVEIPNFEPKEHFLLMFSIVTFHLEIISANMTFTNQSMIIHVKDI